ncbi:hypothetical protein Tco_0615384 [Tanacetum coccineum]
MIRTRPLLHIKTQDKRALKIKDQGHKRDLNDHPLGEDDVLKESLTMGVPLIRGTRFTIETVTIEYEWKPPRCDLCSASKSSYVLKNQPLKAIVHPTKKGNITMSNSYAALDDESKEDVENVYDESSN